MSSTMVETARTDSLSTPGRGGAKPKATLVPTSTPQRVRSRGVDRCKSDDTFGFNDDMAWADEELDDSSDDENGALALGTGKKDNGGSKTPSNA
jgi:hypothetical protein